MRKNWFLSRNKEEAIGPPRRDTIISRRKYAKYLFTHTSRRPSDQFLSPAAPERNMTTALPAEAARQSPQTSLDRSRALRTTIPTSTASDRKLWPIRSPRPSPPASFPV